MEFKEVFTVQKEITPEQFLRTLLVELGSKSGTPTDVCSAEFGEVKESVKEVIVCRAHVECDYTASVGYDRKEEYWDKEKRTQNGQTYYVDVKKTRTVTDWHPHNGHIAGDTVGVAFNEEPRRAGYSEHVRLVKAITSIQDKDNHVVEGGEAAVTHGGLETAKQNCGISLERDIKYPGDHVKDAKTKHNVEVLWVACYKVPYYEVEFIYKGKTYHASSIACGDPNVETEYPPNDVNNVATAKESIKLYKKGIIGSLIAMPVLFIVFLAIGVAVPEAPFIGPLGIVFALIAGACALTLFLLGNKKYQKTLDKLNKETNALKLENLKQAIAKYGYKELTEDEIKRFIA